MQDEATVVRGTCSIQVSAAIYIDYVVNGLGTLFVEQYGGRIIPPGNDVLSQRVVNERDER